jgi:pyrimidine-nucleoside phosphorylase
MREWCKTSMSSKSSSQIIIDAIKNKRAGYNLSDTVISDIITNYLNKNINDYEMASWIATISSIGMSFQEVKYLTESYVNSSIYKGNDHFKIEHKNFVVDKHSTGGVGDKVTLIVVPIVAACGVPVVKISGRSLGHAGGTLDKLESIKGLKLELKHEELQAIFESTGMVITGQSHNLVPADKATYSLRDLIGYEDSIPLIAASIISKKVVTGANGLVLDVKTGSGALIEDYYQSKQLAELMLRLASEFRINCRVVLSDMKNPLGYAIGNILEIEEALDVLKGKRIPNLTELSIVIARLMLQLADPLLSDEEAVLKIENVINSGEAYNKFLQWVNMQGGNIKQLTNNLNFRDTLYKDVVSSEKAGWIESIDAKTIGKVMSYLVKNSSNNHNIDHSAGIILLKHVGDYVEYKEPIAEIYHNKTGYDTFMSKQVLDAFNIGKTPTAPKPIIHEIL